MLVDLSLKDSRVLIIGAGKVGLRKARSVLSECDHVMLASDRFTVDAERVGRAGAKLVKADLTDMRTLGRLLSASDLVIAATNDYGLNRKIAREARSRGVMIGSVDDPSDSDFNFPAVRSAGKIRVGVATGGRSPAMARAICKRLVGEITREDRLWVDLMEHVRTTAKRSLPTPADRRTAVYRVMNDRNVAGLLESGQLANAKGAADAIVRGV